MPHQHVEPDTHAAVARHPDAHDRLLFAVQQLEHRLLQRFRRSHFALVVEARVDSGGLSTQPEVEQTESSKNGGNQGESMHRMIHGGKNYSEVGSSFETRGRARLSVSCLYFACSCSYS